MSIDEKTDKPATTEPAATETSPATGARRRIVRSASTRAAEAAAAEAAAAAKASEPPAPAPAAKAEAAAPAPVAEHTPKRFDVRAAKPTTPKPPSGDRPRPPRTDGPRKPWAPRNEGRPDGARPPRRDARPDRGPRPPRPEADKPITWTDAHPATRSDAKPAAPRTDAKPAPRVEAPKAKPAAPPPPPPKPAAPKAQPLLALPGKARAVEQPAAKPALTAKEALAAKAARHAQSHAPAKAKASDRPAAGEAGGSFSAEQLTAGFEGAVAAIREAGERGVALVEAWTTSSNAAALVVVSEANDVASVARKAARRALNVLKARGVEMPAAPRASRVPEAAPTALEAMFQPPDPTGAVSFSITSREPSGRFHIAEVIAREPIGILQAAGGWISGSQLREGRARATASLGVGPVPVPVEWARHRIALLRQQNATSGQVIPLGYEACRELVEAGPQGEPAHPIADLDGAITSEKAWAIAPASKALHDEPEFRSWLPDRGAVDELLQKVGERLGVDGVNDSEKVNDALREEIDAATDRFFSPEVRAVVASRMRDAAISVRARRGDERATEVVGTAKAVVEAGLITSPPREIPFLVAFFQKAIGFLAQQNQLRVPVRQQPAETPAAT
jgi:hypothetical protein